MVNDSYGNPIPRRADRLRHTDTEKAITHAMELVESLGADVRLSDALMLLDAARDSVADFVDNEGFTRRGVKYDPYTK